MKKIYITITSIVILSLAGIIVSGFYNSATGYSAGPPSGASGSLADGGTTCSQGGCHNSSPVSTLSVVMTSNVPVSGYIPGTTYSVTATFNRTGHTKFGFEASAELGSGSQIILMENSPETQLAGSSKYVQHTGSGISGTNSKTWNFAFTAPAAGSGTITFYGSFNASNSNFAASGDSIFTSQLAISEDLTASVNNNIFKTTEVKVYPTIVSSDLSVRYTLTTDAQISIRIIDLNGRTVKVISSEKQFAGEHAVSLDCTDIANGTYFVHTSIGGQWSTDKIIIQK